MTIDSIQFTESYNRKQTRKSATTAITIVFLIAASVIVCQIVASLALGIVTVFYPELDDESIYVTMALYLFYIGAPILLGNLIFKLIKNKKSYNFVKRSSTKRPFIFVMGAIGTGYIFNILVSLLFPSIIENSEEIGMTATSVTEVLLNFLMYAIIPAILEEILFRGIILKNLLPYSKWGAIILSALLFGITHMNPIQILFASIFGVILGVCYEYTGSLLIPIIMHFINNAMSVGVTLSPNESLIQIVLALSIYVFIGFAIYAIVFYSKNGYKLHKASRLEKPIGYYLSTTGFIFKSIFNVGFLVYAGLLASILVILQ